MGSRAYGCFRLQTTATCALEFFPRLPAPISSMFPAGVSALIATGASGRRLGIATGNRLLWDDYPQMAFTSTCARGELVACWGHRAAAKHLLRLIAGFEWPQRGRI